MGHAHGSYPKVYRGDHPLSPPSGIVARHRIILYDRIGPGEHACHWCGHVVHWETGHKRKGDVLLVDHIDNDRGNLDPRNLVPCCNRCNTRRDHPGNIRPDEAWIVNSEGNRTRAIRRVCKNCDGTFLIMKSQINERPFAYCSPDCRVAGERKERDTAIADGELRVTVTEKDGRVKYLHAVRRTCLYCGKGFVISRHRVTQGAGRYCSLSCSSSARWRGNLAVAVDDQDRVRLAGEA